MNKTGLKNFASSARRELLERVELQARKIGITSDSIQQEVLESSDATFIGGKQLSKEERTQRNKLINRINEIGFNRVMEEAAYTWFNRFTALRFMEVNEYLPTKVRVLSSIHADSAEPDMMKEALSLDLDLDKEYVYKLKMNNNTDELFKYLIIKHCNDLNRFMPFMFEKINDYTELLFPEGLLATDSFIRQITNTENIPEDTWEQIEVIGWLYQYYISEQKDRVFKAKSKYKAEEIPFATQLFTPDWIVQYMVQNSLGRYWVEAHPEHRDMLNDWEFYLQNQDEDFEKNIAPYVNKELKVEDIKCFDPAMGSGHILVYMFDILFEIYSKCGYMDREIPRLIIENNLYGLDIDNRAYQLASFSIVMKAQSYNHRFLKSIERNGLNLNLTAIQETNLLTEKDIEYLAGVDSGEIFENTKSFVEQFQDAKTIGSLIKVSQHDTMFLIKRLESIKSSPANHIFETGERERVLSLLPMLIKQDRIMGQAYDVLVTNPPYMGARNMNTELSSYLNKNYPDSKGDLFASFMELDHYLKKFGFYASINQHSWMFLSSFEKLREKIISNKFIENMLHMGPRAFEEIGGEVVQSTSFILRNVFISNVQGNYVRLIDERTASKKRDKTLKAVQNFSLSDCYSFNQENFNKIPGSPIAYWASDKTRAVFEGNPKLSEVSEPRQGMASTNNDLFLRKWYEVNLNNIGFNFSNETETMNDQKKWFPFNKGGEFRKWYGNNEYLVNFQNMGKEVCEYIDSHSKVNHKGRIINREYYFKEGVTWSAITSSKLSVRFSPKGFIFSNAGMMLFSDSREKTYYILGLMNSKLSRMFSQQLSSTINFDQGIIARLPYKESQDIENKRSLISFVESSIEISKKDWDSYETSWDFQKNVLLLFKGDMDKIESAFKAWKHFNELQFKQLKTNEEEINRILIDIYDMQEEVTSEVDDNDITIRKAVLMDDIKSFISYAVGCAFGRYSLDEEGLIYAGGEYDSSRYQTFTADEDNILPILTGAYFKDDILTKFIQFIRMTFGDETLELNLNFIADVIGRKKNETGREVIRRYFVNDYYKNHLQMYKKRPIYWMFTSGKEKAFNCLIYMHRYDKTTLSRIRTDYLHEVQTRLDAEKKDLLNIIESDSGTKEISNAKKELKSLDKKIDELKAYDELLHHMADMQIEIDLDDGVVVNYEKFKGLVAKI